MDANARAYRITPAPGSAAGLLQPLIGCAACCCRTILFFLHHLHHPASIDYAAERERKERKKRSLSCLAGVLGTI